MTGQLRDTFTFRDLPKISLNEWYAGNHWSKRKKIKDQFIWLVRAVTNKKIDYACEVEYEFTFTKNALDCSNTIAMVKMIEDCLFDDDGIKIVKSIRLTSRKGNDNLVNVRIREY